MPHGSWHVSSASSHPFLIFNINGKKEWRLEDLGNMVEKGIIIAGVYGEYVLKDFQLKCA